MSEYNKEDIKNLHYNNNNEIQYEYGGQIYHCSMEHLKEVLVTCWNLQQENKQLKDKLEFYSGLELDKTIDKTRLEYNKLQQENKKYKEVIDKLKTNIENDIDGFRTINEFGESNEILELLDIYLDILKEVE